MPFLLARLARLVSVRLRGWRLSLAVAAFVFATSWPLMALAEPGNDIVAPANYWWWFLVTAATVGYGDFFPESLPGHLVGAYVIVGGIVALTILFTALAARIQSARGKRMKGLDDVDLTGHLVLLGYTPGRTEGIVAELAVEGRHDIVLCARDDDVAEHPMPERERLRFVRGDLTTVEVLTRAGVGRAATVIVDGHDDNEALTLTVAVDHLNPGVHIVAALRDMNRCDHLRYVHSGVQCVQWHVPKMLTEEALDPGITQVYAELLSSSGTGNTYSARLPEGLAGRTFGDCQTRFGRGFAATLLAVRHGDGLAVSPPWDEPVRAGSVLYYVAAQRIDQARLTSLR